MADLKISASIAQGNQGNQMQMWDIMEEEVGL